MNRGFAAKVTAGIASACGAYGVLCALAPTPAFADGSGISAFDLLIPKPEEFIPALVAFLIIWFVLAKFIWPSVVKTLDERQETIQHNLDEAEQNKLNTERAFKQAQKEIDKAQTKADDIVSDAKRQADASRAAILEQANKDAKHIADKARENIQIERENAETELTDQAANLAVDLATKIVGEQLDDTVQQRLIENALKDVKQQKQPGSKVGA